MPEEKTVKMESPPSPKLSNSKTGYMGKHGHFHHHPPTSGLAVAGLILGFISSFGWMITAVPGLILSFLGLKQVNLGTRRGINKARTGIVLNLVFMFFPIVLILLIAGWYVELRLERAACVSHLKRIGLALRQYEMDNKGFFPLRDGHTGLRHLVAKKYLDDDKILSCPGPQNEEAKYYIYLGGLKPGSKDSNYKRLPLVMDHPGNHRGIIFVLFEDGFIKDCKTDAESVSELIEELHEQIQYPPEQLKILREKAAQADKEQLQK
jgi:hypothetical protein